LTSRSPIFAKRNLPSSFNTTFLLTFHYPTTSNCLDLCPWPHDLQRQQSSAPCLSFLLVRELVSPRPGHWEEPPWDPQGQSLLCIPHLLWAEQGWTGRLS
jgi:hypothetical protein